MLLSRLREGLIHGIREEMFLLLSGDSDVSLGLETGRHGFSWARVTNAEQIRERSLVRELGKAGEQLPELVRDLPGLSTSVCRALVRAMPSCAYHQVKDEGLLVDVTLTTKKSKLRLEHRGILWILQCTF